MLPNVKVNMMENEDTEIEGAGNFGLIGGEQRIYVPQEFVNTSYKNEELVAFSFMHFVMLLECLMNNNVKIGMITFSYFQKI